VTEKKQSKIRLYIGQRGSGKSFAVRHHTEPYKRIIYFDTLGYEYRNGVIFYRIEALIEFWLKHYRENFRLIYRPINISEDFNQIADLVWRAGNLAFVIEEIDLFASSNYVTSELRNIIQRGRHRDIDVFATSQRPRCFSRILTSQAKEMFIFSTKEPADLKYFSHYLGESAAEQIKNLEKYHCLHWEDPDKITIEKI